MVEKDIVVDQLRLTYDGLFSVKELYKLITEWLEEKGYDQKETKNIESITPDGKYIEIELLPWKKFTDYIKSMIRIRMIFSGIKEVEVEKDGIKIKLNQGKAQFVFDGYLQTDWENRWEEKPAFILIRTLFDKYFYSPFMTGYRGHLKDNVMDLQGRIKAFLNLYRY